MWADGRSFDQSKDNGVPRVMPSASRGIFSEARPTTVVVQAVSVPRNGVSARGWIAERDVLRESCDS